MKSIVCTLAVAGMLFATAIAPAVAQPGAGVHPPALMAAPVHSFPSQLPRMNPQPAFFAPRPVAKKPPQKVDYFPQHVRSPLCDRLVWGFLPLCQEVHVLPGSL